MVGPHFEMTVRQSDDGRGACLGNPAERVMARMTTMRMSGSPISKNFSKVGWL
jgi:hypothetical protein